MAELKVLTLNINTGHGAEGHFRQRMDRATVIRNLGRIAGLIDRSGADLACLQEADACCRRTADVNQADQIRRMSCLRHLHYHSHHRSPIPAFVRGLTGFPDNVVLNRDMGTAILSRYPLFNTRHYDFGQSFTSSGSVNYFARLLNESKGYTFGEFEAGGRRAGILNVHLLNDVVYEILRHLGRHVRGETFARAWQVEKLIEHLKEFAEKGRFPIIVAGDFNTIPRESGLLHFGHSKNGDPDDYRRDISMYLLRESGLIRTIPELFGKGTAESMSPYYTYPAVEPDRTVDYVFVTDGIEFLDYRVIADPVSDHRAVLAVLRLKE